MKSVKYLAAIIAVMVSSCSLDPPYTKYYNVLVNITAKNIPSSGVVNIPVNMQIYATAPNGCYSDIHFLFKENSVMQYELGALATFESHGACTDMLVGADTLITLTPDKPGNYVIKTWMSPDNFEFDTIVVTEPLR